MLKCKTCIHKRNIPGDAHISCDKASALVFNVSEHGVSNGWFMFPFSFDPIWAEDCIGYNKEVDFNSLTDDEIKKMFFKELSYISVMINRNFKGINPLNKHKLLTRLTFAQKNLNGNHPDTQSREELITQIKALRVI